MSRDADPRWVVQVAHRALRVHVIPGLSVLAAGDHFGLPELLAAAIACTGLQLAEVMSS
jgi:hypothetical protein